MTGQPTPIHGDDCWRRHHQCAITRVDHLEHVLRIHRAAILRIAETADPLDRKKRARAVIAHVR